LLDVAASYANYCADLTRTIPVNGCFTRHQKQVYNAVLSVLRAASQAATPGKLPKDWQKEADAFVEKELVDLGLLKMADIKKQDPNEPAFRKYFMHGVGHPLGLDVHDLERFQKLCSEHSLALANSAGGERYRASLHVLWKRSSPHRGALPARVGHDR